jgi:hypothetical protein
LQLPNGGLFDLNRENLDVLQDFWHLPMSTLALKTFFAENLLIFLAPLFDFVLMKEEPSLTRSRKSYLCLKAMEPS